MAYRDGAGVGGWLAFFVVTLALGAAGGVILTITTLLTLRHSPHPTTGDTAWSAYMALTAILGLSVAASRAYLAWRLNTRLERTTPRAVAIGLWIVTLLPSLIDSVAGAALLHIDAYRLGQIAGASLVTPLLYASIWTIYLRRSRRVALTYGTAADDTELATLFR